MRTGAETARRFRAIRPQDGWGTPRGLFNELDAEFGFTLDVCATPDLAKCERFYTPEQNGLTMPWEGSCWMNPPYSLIEPWTKKAVSSARAGATVVGLLPVRTDLPWFQRDVIGTGAEIRFIAGRIRFDGSPFGKGHNAPFPSMIVVWRPTVTRDRSGEVTE